MRFRYPALLGMLFLLLLPCGAQSNGYVEITDPNAVQFNQPTFTEFSQPYLDHLGFVFVDFQLLCDEGFSNGYIEVLEFDDANPDESAWIIQDLPIADPSRLRATTEWFNFQGPVMPRASANMLVLFTAMPGRGKPNVPIRPGPRPVAPRMTRIGGIANNFPPNIPQPPARPVVSNVFPANTNVAETNLFDGDSVEQDVNQCAPASVNNSLEYLKQEQGLAVDGVTGNMNVPGTRPERGRTTNSRVGNLDSAMNRARGQATSYRNMIEGKLRYVKTDGIDGMLTIKHQGVFCAAGNVNCIGRNGQGAAQDVTFNGVTSTTAGLVPTGAFIRSELDAEEDVEMCFAWTTPSAGAHCVHVTGYSIVNGELRLNYIHDDHQGANGGVAANEGGHGTIVMKKVTINNTDYMIATNFRNAIVTNVITESKK